MVREASTTDATRPWRLRRPILSRVILYAVGTLLVAGIVFALARRQAEDEAEHLLAMRLKLQHLPLTLAADPTGGATLAMLDEEYAPASLPPSLHPLRSRIAALALLSGGRAEDAVSALVEGTLDDDPVRRAAATIELAQTLTRLGRATEALDRLAGLTEVASPERHVLATLRARAVAFADEKGGAPATDVVAASVAVLDALPRPLPIGPDVFFEGHDWTAPEAALVLVQGIVEREPERAASAWPRLLELVPGDVRIAVEAAAGLGAEGLDEPARAALERARNLNAGHAGAYLERILASWQAPPDAADIRAAARSARADRMRDLAAAVGITLKSAVGSAR